MAEVFLIRFQDSRGAVASSLRDIAHSLLPANNRRYKVGSASRQRFKVNFPGGDATIGVEDAIFDLDEPDFTVVSLIYEIGKAGGMAVIDSGCAPGAIVFNREDVSAAPAEFRRPKPTLCTSAEHLARLFGVSTRKPPAARKLHKRYLWSTDHTSRYKGSLTGTRDGPQESHIYIQAKPGENDLLIHQAFWKFVRPTRIAERKFKLPEGGGVTTIGESWELRLPRGEVFVGWTVTGYSWRRNSDHLIPVNVTAWLTLVRKFARSTGRLTGTVVKGKAFVLDNGRRYPLTRLESRRGPDQ